MATLWRTIVLVMLASTTYALDVYLQPEISGSNKPAVRVKTNLPDATKVVITVSNPHLDYSAQVSTEVAAGCFEGGPFLVSGAALGSGSYTLSIAVELAQFQPLSVQAVIGSRGEQLQGTLVRRGMLGNRVFYSTEFDVI